MLSMVSGSFNQVCVVLVPPFEFSSLVSFQNSESFNRANGLGSISLKNIHISSKIVMLFVKSPHLGNRIAKQVKYSARRSSNADLSDLRISAKSCDHITLANHYGSDNTNLLKSLLRKSEIMLQLSDNPDILQWDIVVYSGVSCQEWSEWQEIFRRRLKPSSL